MLSLKYTSRLDEDDILKILEALEDKLVSEEEKAPYLKKIKDAISNGIITEEMIKAMEIRLKNNRYNIQKNTSATIEDYIQETFLKLYAELKSQ